MVAWWDSGRRIVWVSLAVIGTSGSIIGTLPAGAWADDAAGLRTAPSSVGTTAGSSAASGWGRVLGAGERVWRTDLGVLEAQVPPPATPVPAPPLANVAAAPVPAPPLANVAAAPVLRAADERTVGANVMAPLGPAAARNEERDASQQLAALVNTERQALGLRPLQVASGLMNVARARVVEVDDRLSHDRPSGTLMDLLRESGVDWTTGAENLAFLEASTPNGAAELAHRLLMNSASHRRNLLTAEFRYVGIGVQQRGSRWYFVQLFAG